MAKKKYYKSKSKGGMLESNTASFANMPQNVIMREYPMNKYAYYELNDTITGIDNQINTEVGQLMKQKSKKRF